MKNKLLYWLASIIGAGALLLVFLILRSDAAPQVLAQTPTASPISTEVQAATALPSATPARPTQTQSPTKATEPTQPPLAVTAVQGDAALFVAETIPDGSTFQPGSAFTKTWTLMNAGSVSWTTDYVLRMFEYSNPLGEMLNGPWELYLPVTVAPGESVILSGDYILPDVEGYFQYTFQLRDDVGNPVSGESVVSMKITSTRTAPQTQGAAASSALNGFSMTLTSLQKGTDTTTAEVCIQLPDTADWMLSEVYLLTPQGQTSLSGYGLKNAKDAATYASDFRCYQIDFPLGTAAYGNASVSLSIGSMRVPPETHLEENCARTKIVLQPLYPGLDFTCGPMGFFYTSLQLPAGLDAAQADRLIMDTMEQAVYGPWVLGE